MTDAPRTPALSMPRFAPGPGRAELGLVRAVRHEFGGLQSSGWREVNAESTYVRFARSPMFVEVFHGRGSYEVGLQLGHVLADERGPEEKYYISDLVSLLAPDSSFRPKSATTEDAVQRVVAELAAVAQPLIAEVVAEPEVQFGRLAEQRSAEHDRFMDEMTASRLRAKADAAWLVKDYSSVVAAYEEMLGSLRTMSLRPSEHKRLEIARRHLDEDATYSAPAG